MTEYCVDLRQREQISKTIERRANFGYSNILPIEPFVRPGLGDQASAIQKLGNDGFFLLRYHSRHRGYCQRQ